MSQCDVERTRGSGPGGQHRNKVETAVRIHHRGSGVTGEASERRSQDENRRVALRRLRVNLALRLQGGTPHQKREEFSAPDRSAAPGVPPRGEPPRSSLWKSRVRQGRIAVRPDHDDFAALLAEALDVLFLHAMQVPEAAGELALTGSQLVRFLKLEPRALALVNQRRAALGLRPLR